MFLSKQRYCAWNKRLKKPTKRVCVNGSTKEAKVQSFKKKIGSGDKVGRIGQLK